MKWRVIAVLDPAGENVQVPREVPFELELECKTNDPDVISTIEASAPRQGLVLERIEVS